MSSDDLDRSDRSFLVSIDPAPFDCFGLDVIKSTNQSINPPPPNPNTQTQHSVGLLALEQHAEKTAAEGVVNFYNFCAGLSLIALGVLYFVMVRALNVGVGGAGVVVVRRICMSFIS